MEFYLGKILSTLMAPSTLLVVWLALAGFLTTGRVRMVLAGIPVFILLFAGLGPVSDWMIKPLEMRFPTVDPAVLEKQPLGGIVILGGGLDPERSADHRSYELTEAADRIMLAASLAIRFPNLPIIVSGGSGDPVNQQDREADYIASILRQWGVKPGRIIVDNQSRRTAEHPGMIARALSVRIGKPIAKPGKTWAIITSAAHMPRAIGVFRKAGWSVIAVPTDYRTGTHWHPVLGEGLARGLLRTDMAAREWAGLVAYYLQGKTSALFPSAKGP